ncbi:hypothetical protein KVR01_003373 [Diaporthe batatas]|uniref:uncharacterized protein n=1 Tax=Diaporthe batatas TaxID=748121 RepID=UPI001D0458FE|nr:uncharacterized protein KVR01_003373 [Diaporthe batatas]KAG8167684.1 hypothetical protein KVR01_003373 [Diaporthe batatas]
MESTQQKHKLINPLTRYEDFVFEFPPNTYPKQVLQTSFKHPPDCGENSYVGKGRLKGRHALVTGGDSGIGRAVVIALAREGAKVAINYLPEEEPDARALAELLDQDACVEHELVRIPGDLRSPKFCHELVHSAHKKLGSLDLIVGNAGTASPLEPITEVSPEAWDDTMKVNLYANFHIIQAAAPLLGPGASIVITDSVGGVIPLQNQVAYTTSKAALRSFINGAGAELIKQGIRINGVAPGYTYTPLLVYGGLTVETLETAVKQLDVIGRVQQPAELPHLYVTLADDQLSYGTGSIYGSHGGFLGGY